MADDAEGCDSVTVLGLDESFRNGTTKQCDCCQRPSERTWCMITQAGLPYAMYFAACYDHAQYRESWIDVIFGTWDNPPDYGDHVTFGGRYGPVQGGTLGLTVVDGASVAPDGPLFGHKLTRQEALGDPNYAQFTEVVDFVLQNDPLLHHHHYGHSPDLSTRSDGEVQ